MSISKRGNVYVELPEECRTPSLKDAKVEVTITITMGKKMERECSRSAEKFIKNHMDDIAKDFKKYIRKQAEKIMDNEDD